MLHHPGRPVLPLCLCPFAAHTDNARVRTTVGVVSVKFRKFAVVLAWEVRQVIVLDAVRRVKRGVMG